MMLSVAVSEDNVQEALRDLAIKLGPRGMIKILRKALTLQSKTIKAAVRQVSAPRKVKSLLLRGVGVNVKSRGAFVKTAKVGFGVGPAHKRAPHVHLFVLGTKDRFTSGGKYRGKVVGYCPGLVGQTKPELMRNVREAYRWYLERR